MIDTRAQIIERVRAAWHWLTIGMIGFFAAQFAIFLIALDVTGVRISLAAAFAAFAIGRLLTAVGITPGGIGITETGTAAALVALGAQPSHAGAAVVIMSIFTNLVELPLGILAWIAWTLDRRKVTDFGRGATHTSGEAAVSAGADDVRADSGESADHDDPSRRRT